MTTRKFDEAELRKIFTLKTVAALRGIVDAIGEGGDLTLADLESLVLTLPAVNFAPLQSQIDEMQAIQTDLNAALLTRIAALEARIADLEVVNG